MSYQDHKVADFIPEGSIGDWQVERFHVTRDQAALDSIRSLGRSVQPGDYTALKNRGHIWMSDTPAEVRDHWEVIYKATGEVLINGLGLGMVAIACLKKPEVTHVTIVEIDQDVIDLVGTHLMDKFPGRVTLVCADAMTWEAPKGKRYNVVWHDIWLNICEDNLEQMGTLHRRYGKRTDWQGSWSKAECLDRRRNGAARRGWGW